MLPGLRHKEFKVLFFIFLTNKDLLFILCSTSGTTPHSPARQAAGHTLSALTHQQETNRHKATGGIGAGKVTEHSSTGDGSEE